MINEQLIAKSELFRALHKGKKTMILPNAWDVISAKMFEECGCKAIGTTSAGVAMSLGYPDGQEIPFETMLSVIKNMVNAVDVPVSADIESGFGKTTKEILHTIEQLISAGVVGINFEDGTGDINSPIYDPILQQEKIAAIREYCDSIGFPLFINARTDIFWLNIGEPESRIDEAIHRVKLYEEAGADCVFVPALKDVDEIQKLRSAVKCPINLLAVPGLPSIDELSEIGIERVSTGSSPFRASTSLLKQIGDEIVNQRTFSKMTYNVLSYGEVSGLVK
ncbi:isocitrate lyase/PEP mutase family protein [Fredinandcohnia onubensis]|uniref:isocitrate lyase/PEP mutase family protein n=1 Tax=Fredinandcohnia onubensis TaxID=1571209 RepID=UPI000C0BDD39|nr:isocitrate lyase/phosphoenolpyruvate mutase family protein [Fredinandcohnia onubensis]